MLRKLFDKYGCDKGSKHKYDEVYQQHFEEVREQPINFLEVGIFKGESTAAWLDYFPNATIYGIDIFTRTNPNDLKMLNDPRCKWLKEDSTNMGICSKIKREWGDVEFDFIIDDGAHWPDANHKTFNNLISFLRPGGKYFIEDLWPLDQMFGEQLNHPWLLKHADRYDMLRHNSMMNDLIANYTLTKYDNRKKSGNPDSYILMLEQ